ncbi:MAG: serine/threonine protein phosphatase [Pirellulales bacterium]|nr:serine/threonine protein phosphatase [Pirellulales bacterium]
MPPRTIAIGDIHGCLAALDRVLAAIEPLANDTLIVLGDYVDRGSDSRGVIARLRQLAERCRLVVLTGNHEEMLLAARDDEVERDAWLRYGGAETLASYGAASLEGLPAADIEWILQGADGFETATHLFVHANYLPDLPLARQPVEVLRWESLWQRVPPRHISGKIAIVGHTAQHEGEIWDLGHLLCIDTYCHGGGWLTAMEVDTRQVWQASRAGELRAK